MGRTLLASLVLAFVSLAGLPAAAQIDRLPKVQARLIAEQGEIVPGGTVAVALEEVIRPGWHTYWVNPGDAGAPSALDWHLPPGWKAGALQWPYPMRLPVGPVMDYGYEGTVWLLTSLTAPADARPGETLTLKAAGSWLVCKDICIPEDAGLGLTLTVSAAPPAAYATVADRFTQARARLPSPSPWPVHFQKAGPLDLFVAAPSLAAAHPADAQFFPLHQGAIKGSAPQVMGFAQNGLLLRLQPGKEPASALDGVLVLTSADGSVQALAVHATPGPVPPANFVESSGIGFAMAILFALLGGLILNLMPCVLPVLAMKALAVASKAHADRREAAREGAAYGAGAVVSFMVLGAAVALLRAGGEAVGWGFQLQEPLAVAGFALLIFAVGLNLSGVFEIAGGITGGDAFTRKGGAVGAFFTGVLAVAVAAPCTAPFMAAALGFALTQSVAMSLVVFAALGAGFAAPFVVIALSPALLRLLPKPGLWMVRFRQALAFPMYAAAAWLLWVLTQEAGPDGLVAALGAMIALAFAAWAWGASRAATARWRHIGAIAALLALAAGMFSFSFVAAGKPAAAASSPAAAASGIASQPYSAARLAALRAQHRAVFVDATAAWCITCLVNEKVAFSNARVQGAFASRNIAYLVADWTNRNPEITALLSAHGRTGVPLYLYYAPGAEDAAVLPQILTEAGVLAAIGAQ